MEEGTSTKIAVVGLVTITAVKEEISGLEAVAEVLRVDLEVMKIPSAASLPLVVHDLTEEARILPLTGMDPPPHTTVEAVPPPTAPAAGKRLLYPPEAETVALSIAARQAPHQYLAPSPLKYYQSNPQVCT